MTLSQAHLHPFLQSLYQRVNDLEADFPSFDTLQALGIQAFQVSLNTEQHGTLNFNPCFFEPQSEQIFQKYPLDPRGLALNQGESMKLSPNPSVQDIMDRASRKYPPGIAPILDNLREEDRSRYIFWHDPEELATELEQVVDAHLSSARLQGPSEYFSLECLKNQIYWDPPPKDGDPPEMQDSLSPEPWALVSHYRYTGDHPRKPHSILSCLSTVCPTETYCGITKHELCVIVHAMLLRVNHKPFITCNIHPVLVLSYMGNRRARIIQALYDGSALVLQYSPCWNFEDAEMASIELFVRYRLSEPAGGDTHTLSIR